jgi:hypothetical protein
MPFVQVNAVIIAELSCLCQHAAWCSIWKQFPSQNCCWIISDQVRVRPIIPHGMTHSKLLWNGLLWVFVETSPSMQLQSIRQLEEKFSNIVCSTCARAKWWPETSQAFLYNSSSSVTSPKEHLHNMYPYNRKVVQSVGSLTVIFFQFCDAAKVASIPKQILH